MNTNTPYNSGAMKNMVSRVKVFCSKVIPLVFDNTLSYYESLCAFCAKVNELCDAVNAQNLTIVEFCHEVELEISKFEEYMQTELNGVKDRLDTVETTVDDIDRRLTDTERDLTSLTETVRGINGRVGTLEINSESMQSDIAELQSIATTHTGQIIILQNTMTALQNSVNSINTALSNKVDKSDVVDIVQENNMSPVTSNAVYETVTGGITPTIADATRSTKGVVQIGDNIDVSNGEISVPKATQLTFGVMYPGVGVSIPQNQAGVLNLDTATENALGGVKIGDNINVANDGKISIPEASTSSYGVVKVGDNLQVDNQGYLKVKDAVAGTVKGAVTIDSMTSNLELSNGVLDVPTGTKNNKGVLQVGANLSINGGVVDVPEASTVAKGVMTIDGTNPQSNPLSLNSGVLGLNIGNTLTVSNGELDVKTMTASQKGVAAPLLGGAVTVSQAGELDVRNASTTQKGAVTLGSTFGTQQTDTVPTCADVYNNFATKSTENFAVRADTPDIDGNSQLYKIDAQGVRTNIMPVVQGGSYTPTDATTSSKGVVQIGDNIDVTSGVISVPDATTSTKGVIKYGNNFQINGNGQLAIATGANVTTDVNGAITVPTADAINKGVVSIGDNVTITNGAISVPDASTSTKGVIKYGNNFQINSNGQLAIATGANITTDANGAITVPTADAINKGVVSIGNNISITNGAISVPDGSALTKGVLKVDGSNGLTVSNGVIGINKADELSYGTVMIGDNIASSNGVISVPNAGVSTAGVVTVGDNISVSDGEISVADATTSTKGVVQKTTSIASGNTDVPTSDAVYQAMQQNASPTILLPKPFSEMDYGDEIILGKATSSVFTMVTNNYYTVGLNGFTSRVAESYLNAIGIRCDKITGYDPNQSYTALELINNVILNFINRDIIYSDSFIMERDNEKYLIIITTGQYHQTYAYFNIMV